MRKRLVQALLDQDYLDNDESVIASRWWLLAVGVLGALGCLALAVVIWIQPRPGRPVTLPELLFYPILAAGMLVLGVWQLFRSPRTRTKNLAAVRSALKPVIETYPAALVASELCDDHQLIAAAWRVVRWLEDAHLPRSASLCVVSPSRFWMNHPVSICLDRQPVAQGNDESGFDVWIDVCPGRHFLELHAGGKRWRNHFDIPCHGRWQVIVTSLNSIAVLLDTQAVFDRVPESKK